MNPRTRHRCRWSAQRQKPKPRRSYVMTFATSAQLARRRRNYRLKKLTTALEALPQSRGRVKLADVLDLLRSRL